MLVGLKLFSLLTVNKTVLNTYRFKTSLFFWSFRQKLCFYYGFSLFTHVICCTFSTNSCKFISTSIKYAGVTKSWGTAFSSFWLKWNVPATILLLLLSNLSSEEFLKPEGDQLKELKIFNKGLLLAFKNFSGCIGLILSLFFFPLS